MYDTSPIPWVEESFGHPAGKQPQNLSNYSNYIKGIYQDVLDEAVRIDAHEASKDPIERYIEGLEIMQLKLMLNDDDTDTDMTDVSDVSPTPIWRVRVSETPMSDARRPASGTRLMSAERKWWDDVPSLL